MNVISDIAGQYDALMALLRKMPDQEVLSVGDMVDRGPKSKDVVDWFMAYGKALLGNHEHMMIDWVFNGGRYQPYIWGMNGGVATLKSYDFVEGDEPPSALFEAVHWMQTLPRSWEDDCFLVSHSADPDDEWSRNPPTPTGKFHIYGHNSFSGLKFFSTNYIEVAFDHFAAYALCIDTSASRQLCGVDLNTMQIYVQEYV